MIEIVFGCGRMPSRLLKFDNQQADNQRNATSVVDQNEVKHDERYSARRESIFVGVEKRISTAC